MLTDIAGAKEMLLNTYTGAQISKLTVPGSGRGEYIGTSVAIRNNVAILGAWSDTSGGIYTGGAYLFDATTGNQTFKLSPSESAVR